MAPTSVSIRPSNETKMGKFSALLKASVQVLKLFSLSAMRRLFYGVLISYDAAFMLNICVSKIQLVLFVHRSFIRRMPLCSESTSAPKGLLSGWDTYGEALPLFTSLPGFMRGSLRTCVIIFLPVPRPCHIACYDKTL